MTAVLFGLVAYVNTVPTNIFDVGRLILAFASMSMFVSIAVYDIKHKIIPNEFVVTLVGIGVAQALLHMWFGQMELMFLVSHIATAIILFLPFYILWVVSKGKWIGLGDGKLAFALGMILPLSSALSGITIAFWVGAVYGLTAIAMSKIGFKKYTLKTEVPFAPFLILGAVLVYFVPLDLFHVLLLQEYVWNLF